MSNEPATLTIQDNEHCISLYRPDCGTPYGLEGVVYRLREACDLIGSFEATTLADTLTPSWLPDHEKGAALDPRWWYEVEVVRGRVLVTVHDLHTWSDALVYALTD